MHVWLLLWVTLNKDINQYQTPLLSREFDVGLILKLLEKEFKSYSFMRHFTLNRSKTSRKEREKKRLFKCIIFALDFGHKKLPSLAFE